MTKFAVIIEGEAAAPVEKDLDDHDQAVGFKAPRFLFVCPWCGTTWGRIEREVLGEWDEYEVEVHSCAKCATHVHPFRLHHKVPGSILEARWFPCGYDRALLAVLPRFLLEREFWLHLKHYGGK